MTQALRLKSLTIGRDYYSSNPDALSCTIEYQSGASEVKLRLTQEQLAGILPIVAQTLVIASREIATDLTARIITSSLALPAPEGSGVSVPRTEA